MDNISRVFWVIAFNFALAGCGVQSSSALLDNGERYMKIYQCQGLVVDSYIFADSWGYPAVFHQAVVTGTQYHQLIDKGVKGSKQSQSHEMIFDGLTRKSGTSSQADLFSATYPDGREILVTLIERSEFTSQYAASLEVRSQTSDEAAFFNGCNLTGEY